MILTALSTSGFSKDDFQFTVPAAADGDVPYLITVGGMARDLDIIHNAEKFGMDV